MATTTDRSRERMGKDLQDILSRYEKGILIAVLDETGWSVRDAAKRLGVRRATLYVKLKKYGILRSPGVLRGVPGSGVRKTMLSGDVR